MSIAPVIAKTRIAANSATGRPRGTGNRARTAMVIAMIAMNRTSRNVVSASTV